LETVCIPHEATNFFSKLNIDYLAGKESLQAFYQFSPDDKGLQEAISSRKQFPVNRKVLVDVLREQYKDLEISDSVKTNIDALLQENTFTITTAHQPNLMTGYLYFIYKIVHAAKLALHLKEQHSDKNFVPVFYIGSEDNDLDELSVFRYNDTKYKWQTEQTGAVGRMLTKDLQPLLKQLTSLLGPPGNNAEQLKEIILTAYKEPNTIAQATRYIVNALLGQYGVVVIDADNAELKKQFLPVIKKELLQPQSDGLVKSSSDELSKSYGAQAFSRPINLFYLKDNLRERIEKDGEHWVVLKTEIKWNEAELNAEIENHPERFSPNVILRGLYQETILPNVAFIGGGSEVAYWLQLKPVFDYYKVFYPAIILRQSVLWMNSNAVKLQAKLELTNEEIFQSTAQLVNTYVSENTEKDLQVDDLRQQMLATFDQIKKRATNIDITLEASAAAALTKMRYQLDIIEKKMMRAEKRKMADELAQIQKFKTSVFPNHSLQERYDTFMPLYLEKGNQFFETLMKHTRPYGDQFLVIKDI